MTTALTMPITSEPILDDLMSTYKVTIPIFIRRKMMCIGCPVVRLHDVRQACREHGVPLDEFLTEVNGAIARASAKGCGRSAPA
jgi:hybrid cluster-associated redox disulfide protein